MRAIDERVTQRLSDANAAIDAPTSQIDVTSQVSEVRPSAYDRTPPTANPSAEALRFETMLNEETEAVIRRLTSYGVIPGDARVFNLRTVMAEALRGSREYRFAEEEFLLAALDLLVEEHRWGPRFFNQTSALVTADADDGLYDTSLRLVNELGVRQRLPYGGEVSARALASATEDLRQRVSGTGTQSADLVLGANLPLLRGSGVIAQESRLQSQRRMIYAARSFEQFRREFLFDIGSEFLDLILAQRRIDNARRGVESFEQLEEQQDALYRLGRATTFEAAEAQNDTLEAIDRLNSVMESYRLALDRFKVRLSLPPDEPIRVEPDRFGLLPPAIDINDAVRIAMVARLDLQTRRDELEDAERALVNARDRLRGDLSLTASARMPTDPDRRRGGVGFEPRETDFEVGLVYDWPLDREEERLAVRESQIRLARSQREYERFRDIVVIAVRSAVRDIDAARFSLDIQERNLEIALRREESIRADPGRATIRQQSDAIDQILRARDALDDTRRDLEVAVLRYLLESGQLRVAADGMLEPLAGMTFSDPMDNVSDESSAQPGTEDAEALPSPDQIGREEEP